VKLLDTGTENHTEHPKSVIGGIYEGLRRMYPDLDSEEARP